MKTPMNKGVIVMDISFIDSNFKSTFTAPEDLKWFSPLFSPFSLHGVYYEESEKRFRRMPQSIADNVNEGVQFLSWHTAGGRVRFKTDSPFVAIKTVEPYTWFMSHMTTVGECGFSLFSSEGYTGTFVPPSNIIMENDCSGKMAYDGIVYTKGKKETFSLYFPLYNGVNELYIGLKEGCVLEKADDYKYKKPVVFYGSSITQGACAAKPGDDYVNRLSALLDADIINLGFSGSARAEDVMINYLCSLNPSVFVIDYDHNAPDVDYLDKTHYKLYKAVRDAHPKTPIVFITMPTFKGFSKLSSAKERKDVIYKTYKTALSSGDKNVYFISGDGFFGNNREWECGIADGIHPNSFGFYLMAKAVYPTLKKILK